MIEFVGDSITCGYGVDDENYEHHFSTKTEDVTKAYAYKAAEALNADYSMVAISGYGIISGYTEGDEPIPEQTIPQYYDTLGFSYGGFGASKPQDIKWDFTKRQPDIIVINLGTNDSSYIKGYDDRHDYFSGSIRYLSGGPRAQPGCGNNMLYRNNGSPALSCNRNAVNTYINETGDYNIGY